MNEHASFQVEVTHETALSFATLSGDWNPLHTDPAYAARTRYGRPILHGAFSAGLVSRMAGMHLPGKDCLLHGMRLKFVAPLTPPAVLTVTGTIVARGGEANRVEVDITDATSGVRYVEASYEFGTHEAEVSTTARAPAAEADGTAAQVVVTGATGGIGQALLEVLGARALGISRRPVPGMICSPSLEQLSEALGSRQVGAIVHCAWPAPDNVPLTSLQGSGAAVEHHVASPVRQILSLARLLREHGTPDALLVLVGSTAAEPGRHNYRMPLYTLGKALVPTLARILALELGATGQRCVAVVFDVVEAGMNQGLSRAARLAHTGRTPTGWLPSALDAATQLRWVLDNRSSLLSGATIALTGGAVP